MKNLKRARAKPFLKNLNITYKFCGSCSELPQYGVSKSLLWRLFELEFKNKNMKPFSEKNKIKIESDEDFNLVADDMFTEFLEGLIIEKGMTRKPREDDMVDEGLEFVYTEKAMRLIETYRRRICRVGNHHFPNGDIVCESWLYIES